MTARPSLTTFRARLTLRWTLAVGLLLGLANLTIYAGARTYLSHWLDHNVRTVAATEAASSTDGSADVHLHESTFAQLESGGFTEKFVQIFDRQGRMVLSSSALADLPAVVPAAAVEAAFDGRSPMMSVSVGNRTARVTVLTADHDGRRFAVAVGLFADDVARGLAYLRWLLAGVWLVSLAATATIGYRLASRALAPVARITERAAWIAEGHFSARLDPPTVHDEVGRMTLLLNSMLDRLHAVVEANRRFAADASHELRSPLTAMAGELDVALRHPRSAEHYQETLRRVRGRLGALTRLTEDLILLVRSQEGSREVMLREVPVRELVEDAFGQLRATAAARGITLRHERLDHLHVYAEPALMARVVDNVVANAVHYNRDGGWVTVTAAVEEPDAGAWATPLVRLRVADTGTGIPEAVHDRVFERFFRVDQSRARNTGGCGLGLAICREVVELHGGTIRVEDSSAAGTAIEIAIPGRGAHPAGADAAAAQAPALVV